MLSRNPFRNLKSLQAKWRELWLAKLKQSINTQTALTLLDLWDGSGVEAQGVACRGHEGAVDALWNRDDQEEVEGVCAYEQGQI